MLLALRKSIRPDRRRRWPTIHFVFDEGVWTARVVDGILQVQSGENATAELVVRTDPWTLNRVLDNPRQLVVAMSEGRLEIEGDTSTFQRLLGTG